MKPWINSGLREVLSMLQAFVNTAKESRTMEQTLPLDIWSATLLVDPLVLFQTNPSALLQTKPAYDSLQGPLPESFLSPDTLQAIVSHLMACHAYLRFNAILRTYSDGFTWFEVNETEIQ